MTTVQLQCVRESNKLRIRILGQGYLPDANCQFPRNIRKEGYHYRVFASDIRLVTHCNKWFYSLRRGAPIEILDLKTHDQEISKKDIHLIIYEDVETEECAICLDLKKSVVFGPCGHFYVCNQCATQLTLCPICRTVITHRINRSEIR